MKNALQKMRDDVDAFMRKSERQRERNQNEMWAAVNALPPCSRCGRKARYRTEPRELLFLCECQWQELRRQAKPVPFRPTGFGGLLSIYGLEVMIYDENSDHGKATFPTVVPTGDDRGGMGDRNPGETQAD